MRSGGAVSVFERSLRETEEVLVWRIRKLDGGLQPLVEDAAELRTRGCSTFTVALVDYELDHVASLSLPPLSGFFILGAKVAGIERQAPSQGGL